MTANIAHPQAKIVDVIGGQYQAKVPKWTMAMRAECKPRIAAILERVEGRFNAGQPISGLADLFTFAESELVDITRTCVVLPDGLAFDDLLWEDLPLLVQAIWEHNLVTDEGEGLAGKVMSLFVPLMVKSLEHLTQQADALKDQPKMTDPSQDLKPSVLNSPASHSSPEDGAPTPTP